MDKTQRPKIQRPGKAANTGPCPGKVILKRGFTSRNILEQRTTQDIYQRKFDLRRKIRLILGN